MSWLKIVVPSILILALVVVVYFGIPKPSPPAPPNATSVSQASCPAPPSPFFAVQTNVETALTESIKVLRARAEPKVLDVIPKEARTLEMIGFLTCQAREQKLILNNADLIEYTTLLGKIHTGKEIKPFVRHLGALENLSRHLRTSTDDFSLTLKDETGLLPKLVVDETSASDWPSWFRKFCVRYEGCIKCDPVSTEVKEHITLSLVGKLVESKGPGESKVICDSPSIQQGLKSGN